jgi:hypothetical protein
MEHFPGVLTRAESDAMVERIEAHFDRYGFGLWAVDVREQSSFIGFVGLAVPSFEAHFTPCVEVGGAWRSSAGGWATQPKPLARRLHSASDSFPWKRSSHSLCRKTNAPAE